MIDPDYVLAYRGEGRQKYDERDVILYALGLAASADDADRRYVFEKTLQVVPTMAVVLAREAFWLNDPRTGIDVSKLLHGEQSVIIHRPLPVAGEVKSELEVVGLYDKGAGRGAVLEMRRQLYAAATGDLLATVGIRSFLRADGGFGGKADGLPAPHPVPERSPDMSITLRTSPEQALIYRLSGDYNPIHIDPEVGKRAGFAGPILHGLCTYGIAARAILRGLLGDDAHRLRQLDVRFSSPVYPGETIVTDIWKEGEGQAAFRCRVMERDIVVINNGLARFDAQH